MKNSEKVLQALSDIPIILSVALEKWQSFKTDEQLKLASIQLYNDSMDAIRTFIDILCLNSGGTSRWSKWVKPHLKRMRPENESATIDQALETVDMAKRNVDNNVDRLDRTRAAETHETVGVTNQLVAGVATKVQENSTEIKELKEMMQEFYTKLMDGYYLIPSEVMQLTEMVHTSFYHLNAEQIYKKGLLPSHIIPNNVPQQHHPRILTHEQLIEILGIHHLSPIEDRDMVLRKGHTMSPHHLGRGRYLLAVPQFQHLLSSPSSAMLLVDGHCKEECDGKVSPISVFCASLAAMMVRDRTYMVLSFFAGQHCPYYDAACDPARGPRGLVRSLISQVLLYPNQSEPQYYLDWVNDTLVNDVAQGRVEALCYLFEELVRRVLDVSAIFCIIDNISDFEKMWEGWDEELAIVFQSLRNVGSMLAPGVCFKILMTSAGKSTQLVQLTHPSERVSLRAGNVLSPEKAGWAMDQDIRRSVSPGAHMGGPSATSTSYREQ